MPTQAEDAAERTARHLTLCQEMAQIGMQLMRAIAAEAMDPAPEETPIQPRPTKAEAAAIINKLARSVRQAILLEARLAADASAAAKTTPAQTRDDRRDYLRKTLHNVAVEVSDAAAAHGGSHRCHDPSWQWTTRYFLPGSMGALVRVVVRAVVAIGWRSSRAAGAGDGAWSRSRTSSPRALGLR